MNKEQKRYIKEIKALMPVYGKYEKRFFHDIKASICELDAEHITYEMLCRKLGRPEDLIVNYYQEIDSTYLRKQREHPKDCVNLQTDVRYNYSVWRFLKWPEKKIRHKKQ